MTINRHAPDASSLESLLRVPTTIAVRQALHARRRSLGAGMLVAALAATPAAALAAPFPPIFPLASLLPSGGGDGSAGFVLAGIDAGDEAGFSVSAAGDVNGDGIDDLLIGAVFADPGGRSKAGESYVVFGRDTQAGRFPAVFQISSLLPGAGGDGSAGFVLNGINAYDFSARRVSAAGDVNDDGIDDLAIGAPFASPGGRSKAGESYVVFGRDTARVGKFPPEFELSSLAAGDGSIGFVLNGIDPADDSGRRVGAAGDINEDGIGDLLIGAPFAARGGRAFAGESYIVFGRNTAQLGNFPAMFPLAGLLPGAGGDGSVGLVLQGIDSADRAGRSVDTAGDLNGDGIDDLVIGGDYADPSGRSDAGETYVVFGRDTAQAGSFPALFQLASLLPSGGGDGSGGFVLTGIDAADHSGATASAAGDVNHDGIGDLLIVAYYADPNGQLSAGESYVVFGRNTAQVGNFPALFPLQSLLPGGGGDGSAGFVLEGIDAYDSSGFSASAAGDVNGDGIDDLIIGAVYADPRERPNAGESYVVFGRDTAQDENFPAVFELSSLATGDGSAGFVLIGIDSHDRSGRSVSAAGDVNGDGIDDLLIGAYLAQPGGRSKAGESYVVFGRALAADTDVR